MFFIFHMAHNTLHIVLAVVLVGLLIALTDPFMYWMPQALAMAALIIATALVALWAGMMLRERGGDEREAHHRMIAGRAGFLAGIVVLTTALVVQGFTHTIDPWIPLTIGVMVVGKLGARLYSDWYC